MGRTIPKQGTNPDFEKKRKEKFEAMPEDGMYKAYCYSVLIIGTIEEEYQGNKKKVLKCNIAFELVDELFEFQDNSEPMPFIVPFEGTFSLSQKANLRKLLAAWNPSFNKKYGGENSDDFDIETIIGVPAYVSVSKEQSKSDTESYYLKFQSIAPIPKELKATMPKMKNEPMYFDVADFNKEVYFQLPKYLREKIASSDEFQNAGLSFNELEEELQKRRDKEDHNSSSNSNSSKAKKIDDDDMF